MTRQYAINQLFSWLKKTATLVFSLIWELLLQCSPLEDMTKLDTHQQAVGIYYVTCI